MKMTKFELKKVAKNWQNPILWIENGGSKLLISFKG